MVYADKEKAEKTDAPHRGVLYKSKSISYMSSSSASRFFSTRYSYLSFSISMGITRMRLHLLHLISTESSVSLATRFPHSQRSSTLSLPSKYSRQPLHWMASSDKYSLQLGQRFMYRPPLIYACSINIQQYFGIANIYLL
jgi:hypothetical protein